jgi:hypothetical protein
MSGECLWCDDALCPDEYEYCDECLQELEADEIDEDDDE